MGHDPEGLGTPRAPREADGRAGRRVVLSIFLAGRLVLERRHGRGKRRPRDVRRRGAAAPPQRLRQGLGRVVAVHIYSLDVQPRAPGLDGRRRLQNVVPRPAARGPQHEAHLVQVVRRLTVLVEGPVQVRARPQPPQIHDRAGDRASLISIDRDPHPQPLAEVARRRPRVPHDVAHAHAVRARPLRHRLPEVEAPRRRPLAWDLHIVGALALRRHARREDMDARLDGLHEFRPGGLAALVGCPALVRLPCTCSAALHLFGCPALIRLPGARVRVRGGSETVGRVRGALDGHSRTNNGHESDCGLLIKKGFGS